MPSETLSLCDTYKRKDRESFFAQGTENNLIPRCGTPDEVAGKPTKMYDNYVLFFSNYVACMNNHIVASGAILFAVENGFVTGTTIDVDGGWLTKL